MAEQKKLPWKNGCYYGPELTSMLLRVDGESCDIMQLVYLDYPDVEPFATGTWTLGDFGPVREDIEEASGGIKKNYDVEINCMDGFIKSLGVLSEDGKTLYTYNMFNQLWILKWLNDEDMKQLADSREPADAPSCHYKIQPENQGKLIWLSGPPGAGKSTTGQLLSRESDWVYYEADCAGSFLNPFVPSDIANPTIAGFVQKPLKGVPKVFVDAVKTAMTEFKKMTSGKLDEIDWSIAIPFYQHLAKDVGQQKKRIGGNFAIAQAVTSRVIRDAIKEEIPECVFITLTLTRETQRKRCIARHGDGEESETVLKFLTEIFDEYELPGVGEKNCYNVDITDEMTPKDVMNQVLEVLGKNCK